MLLGLGDAPPVDPLLVECLHEEVVALEAVDDVGQPGAVEFLYRLVGHELA